MSEMGDKETEGKLRWDLLPYRAVEEVVKVYTYGCIKYDDWNWYKGIPYTKLFGGMMRHVMKYWIYREEIDEENQCHHLASVVFYCLAFMTFDFEGRGRDSLDDRKESVYK